MHQIALGRASEDHGQDDLEHRRPHTMPQRTRTRRANTLTPRQGTLPKPTSNASTQGAQSQKCTPRATDNTSPKSLGRRWGAACAPVVGLSRTRHTLGARTRGANSASMLGDISRARTPSTQVVHSMNTIRAHVGPPARSTLSAQTHGMLDEQASQDIRISTTTCATLAGGLLACSGGHGADCCQFKFVGLLAQLAAWAQS